MTARLALLHAAATLFMTGLIWFVQIVHYPLFAAVGVQGFSAYADVHVRLTTAVVAGPMLVEMVTGLLLYWHRPVGVAKALLGWGVVSLLLIWTSTWLLQVPQHRILSLAFDAEAHSLLVATNWLRTGTWSLRSLLALAIIARTQR